MSLMKLLRTTNSLSAAEDHPHRYKVRRGALPTFGNPSGTVLERKFAVVNPARIGRESEVSGVAVEAQAMKTETVAERTAIAAAPHAFPSGRWTLKVNPFKSARAPVPRPAIQGELSRRRDRALSRDLVDVASPVRLPGRRSRRR